jgi:hypothetical protein
MDIEITYASIVRDGEHLQRLVQSLQHLYGPEEEIDVFEERLVFKPQVEVGNMNYVIRDSNVRIVYDNKLPDRCDITYLGAPVDNAVATKFPRFRTVSTRSTNASSNFRNILGKSGFTTVADFAKKGIQFCTRTRGQSVVISRPYNAAMSDEKMRKFGTAIWTPLPGPLPFKQDYLFELTQQINGTEELEAACESLTRIVNKIGI